MPKPALDTIRAARRDNLTALLERLTPSELARKTGISEPYLWQMAKGTGRNMRGISDERAQQIERAAGLPEGALSWPRPEPYEEPAENAPRSYDRARMEEALRATMEFFAVPRANDTPDARVYLALTLYDALMEDIALEKALHFVTGALRAFETRTTTTR